MTRTDIFEAENARAAYLERLGNLAAALSGDSRGTAYDTRFATVAGWLAVLSEGAGQGAFTTAELRAFFRWSGEADRYQARLMANELIEAIDPNAGNTRKATLVALVHLYRALSFLEG